MDKYLKTVVFWFSALVPVVLMFYILNIYGNYFFISSILIYVLLYRPIIHIFRLLDLGKIEERDAWKFFIPFYHIRYDRYIWFG